MISRVKRTVGRDQLVAEETLGQGLQLEVELVVSAELPVSQALLKRGLVKLLRFDVGQRLLVEVQAVAVLAAADAAARAARGLEALRDLLLEEALQLNRRVLSGARPPGRNRTLGYEPGAAQSEEVDLTPRLPPAGR